MPDLNACFKNIVENNTIWADGATDVFGNTFPHNNTPIVGMSYNICTTRCGGAPQSFDMTIFSSQFSAFMLPFLALTAQLPFGGHDRWHNFSTIPLTIGSPMLAIFSLVITLFNSRWLKKRFRDFSHHNRSSAIVVLNNLQQSLLRIEPIYNGLPLLASLIALPANHDWWVRARKKLCFTQTWTIANWASIIWALIAYIFTFCDIKTAHALALSVIGPAVGCAFVWLLPLVVGWLFTSPNCEEDRLIKNFRSLNNKVYAARCDDGSPSMLSPDCGHFPIMVWPPHSGRKAAQGFSQNSITDAHNPSFNRKDLRGDEAHSSPFFNYARVFSWARSVEQVALTFECINTVSKTAAGNTPRNTHLNTQVFDRLGSTEASNISLSTLGPVPNEARTPDLLIVHNHVEAQRALHGPWVSGVWSRLFAASTIALGAQWLSTGTATMLAWRTPTVGLGCHSGSFLLHGVLATITFLCIISGEIVRQYDHFTTPGERKYRNNVGVCIRRFLATGLRRTGKTIGYLNAIFFLSMAMLSFANIFFNCWCSAAYLGLRGKGYLVMDLSGNPQGFIDWWVACISVATTTAAVLMGFFWAMS